MEKKFLLRKNTGDQAVPTETGLKDFLQKGQCKAADLLFDYTAGKWMRVGDHPSLSSLFAEKPGQPPERRVIYFLAPGSPVSAPQGPFSMKEIQQRVLQKEICLSTWVFVEGDKGWRQVRGVKVLHDMLPPLPTDVPADPEEAGSRTEAPLPADPGPQASGAVALESPSLPSIHLELGGDAPQVEREEITMAVDVMGLNLHSASVPPPPALPKAVPPPVRAPTPPPAPPPSVTAPERAGLPQEPSPAAPKPLPAGGEGFDGLVAEIPTEPIWLVKRANSEAVSGPFRFLEVVKFLEEGKLTKSDKVARTGTKAFVKIQQQYEFNVKFSVESVMENGQERQKLLIRRRHPRVPYITGVQILSKQGLLAGQCVNISAGGILMEVSKADFTLGEVIEVKILPGLINKAISCRALVIGKVPKMPPGYALKFEDLKPEDKESIQFYVQETLKRGMTKKN